MDSDDGGQILDPQRKAAAEIARRKVLAAYGKTGNVSQPNITNGAGAYAVPNSAHMKEEPINSRINSESWKKYHSEWQNYYQKYYSDYYSNAAKQYICSVHVFSGCHESASSFFFIRGARELSPSIRPITVQASFAISSMFSDLFICAMSAPALRILS